VSGVFQDLARAERAAGIAGANVKLLGLSVFFVHEDRHGRWLRRDTADGLAFHLVEMNREQPRCRLAELVEQLSREPVLECVLAVGFLKRGVVTGETQDFAVIVDSDQQGSTGAVEERGDGLDDTVFEGLFQARWSRAVHEEWIRALLRKRPDLSREKLDRTRMLMDKHATDALVTGYEELIEGLNLPDPDDRHVLAAAIRGRANVIVTSNLKDFPEDALEPYGIEAQHPDEFVLNTCWAI
jgi:predicted nucleic acid-binding protein